MTLLQSTGSMVFPPAPKRREGHLRPVPSGDDLDWDRTPMDVGSTAPALRDAVTMFSGALDDIGVDVRIAVVKGFNGQLNVLGPTPWLEIPFSFIGVRVAPAQVSEISDVLEAFEQVRAELGLTQREMFEATGIKKRTYHSWKRKPADARPRVSSQGRFWRLMDALEDLRDVVDRPLDQWIRGDQRRLSTLLDGRFDDLIDLAVNRALYPKRSIGDSVNVGVAEDIETPIIRSGKTNIIDAVDGI
ncbi:helix-turn-helix domain-containing protein [Mycobacterium malmoense]|uniref:helix-turn-helix domain-containing protein n=1 Tax=Mycobacterium malmoense TaxID=1780 RepID=UPI00114D49C2|nr:helix-turn-helix transcriptional regulator [Mycobacterium malmoense]